MVCAPCILRLHHPHCSRQLIVQLDVIGGGGGSGGDDHNYISLLRFKKNIV